MSMTTEKIGYRTEATVKSMCDTLAPSCIACPLAKPVISVDKSIESDETKVKISLRCNKMHMLGPACPDGGEPGKVYLKDLGIPRNLGDDQLTAGFAISSLEPGSISSEIVSIVRAPDYISAIYGMLEDKREEKDRLLHELHETIDFVQGGIEVERPIVWRGSKTFDTFHSAKAGYIGSHIQHYRQHMDPVTLTCDPTPYMKEHFPEEYRVPFGIFTEFGEKDTTRQIRRMSHPDDFPRDIIKEPEPEVPNDELYEDWGSFA